MLRIILMKMIEEITVGWMKVHYLGELKRLAFESEEAFPCSFNLCGFNIKEKETMSQTVGNILTVFVNVFYEPH